MKLLLKQMINVLHSMNIEERIDTINEIKKTLHELSPFSNEPVDCVLWVKNEKVHANDYNPNNVAPPEMILLQRSIKKDGFTQPIVTMIDENKNFEVIDGFHRNRVGKEIEEIRDRLFSYLPVVQIRKTQSNKRDRIAATIRHNRARGKHTINGMSDIVVDLKKRNWSPKKIARELGMDMDEVLRLSQISGLIELFNDKDFSNAWSAIDSNIIEEENIE